MSPFQMLWKNLEEEIFHTESVLINKHITTQIVSEQKRNCTGLIKSQKIYAFKGKDSWVSFLLCNARTSRQLITTTVDRTSMLFAKMYQKNPIFFSVSVTTDSWNSHTCSKLEYSNGFAKNTQILFIDWQNVLFDSPQIFWM